MCCSDEECSNPVTSVLEYRCLVPFSVHPSCPGGCQYTGEQWHQIPNPLFWCWQFQATCPSLEHTCNIPICAGALCGTEQCLSSVPVLAPQTMMWLSVTHRHIFIQPNLSTLSGPQDKPPAVYCLFICTLFSSFPIVFYCGSVFFGGAGLGELLWKSPSNPAFHSDTFCRGELEYMGQNFYLFSFP